MENRSKVLASVPLVIMIFLLLASSVNTYAATPEKKIIVAGDAQFSPYEFVDYIDGKQVYRGFNVDILKALGLETGYEIDFQPMVWTDALAALDRGEVDVIEGMKYDRSRVEKYDFSEEYMINSQAIFVLKDMRVIREVKELGVEGVLAKIPESGRYYVSIDVDVLDISIAAGAGSPMPGGLLYDELNDLLAGLAQKGEVVCFDFVEVAPQYDPTGVTCRVAALTILNFMGHILKNMP